MNVYTPAKPTPQEALLWDKDVRPWFTEGDMWKESTPNAVPETKTWKELLLENGPLTNSQSKALQYKIDTGEAYLISYVKPANATLAEAARAVNDRKAEIRQGVFGVADLDDLLLVPVNSMKEGFEFIEEPLLRKGKVLILGVEEMVPMPREALRILARGGDQGVSFVADWYKHMYGKEIGE